MMPPLVERLRDSARHIQTESNTVVLASAAMEAAATIEELVEALTDARATLAAIVTLTFLDSDFSNAAENGVKRIDAFLAKIGSDA